MLDRLEVVEGVRLVWWWRLEEDEEVEEREVILRIVE